MVFQFRNLMILFLFFVAPVNTVFVPIAGENQWRMIARIGECINNLTESTSAIEQELLSIGDSLCSKIMDVDQDLLSIGDVLCSKIMEIDRDTSSTETLIISISETIQENLISISDILTSKIMAIDCTNSTTDELIISISETIEDNLISISDVLTSKIMAIDCTNSSNDELIISIADQIEQDLFSIGDALCSKIMDVDQDLLSISDELNDKLMSIGGECCSETDSLLDVAVMKLCAIESLTDIVAENTGEIATNTEGATSIFGELIVQGRDEHICTKFQYGVPSTDVASTTTGTGTITTVTSLATLSTGVGAVSSARIDSRKYVRYQSAHEGFGYFSARYTTGVANSTQWAGLLDDVDGFAIGYNGTTFSVLYRNTGVDTIIPQSSFNVDTLDGTGPSGIVLDPTKLNVYKLLYGWLGASAIEFFVQSSDNTFVLFHRITRDNQFTVPSFDNPFLPMRAEVVKTAGASNIVVALAGWAAGLVGQFRDPACSRLFSISNLPEPATTTEGHVLTIRNKTTFAGKINRVDLRVVGFGGGDIGTGTNRAILRLRRNATVAGTAFVDINTTSSVTEWSNAGVYALGTGELVLIQPTITSGNGPTLQYFADNLFDLILLPGETLTITAQTVGGPSADMLGVLSWIERF